MSKASTPSKSKSAPRKVKPVAVAAAPAATVAHYRGTPTKARGALSKAAESIKSIKALAQPEPAAVRTKTLRLQPSYEQGLAILKRVLNIPVNKMVNEAVGEYIQRRTLEVESQLTTTLEQLQAYRRADPEFLVARQAFIHAEAQYGKDDPMEGRMVRVKPSARVVAKR